ncbi:VWA domain-containing protein [Halioxenophilus sp. WMMB6]|uniref:vWA domain-containing protein n=1 Tax=Halioxenophilus sp. WMMB6 TaxID=3073815 RepID=UPI00295EE20A|nr:VWA domain-containing protein [Halioxenophilus sp. WMMB6]
MLSFEWPWVFLLIPLPLLVWRWLPAAKDTNSALLVPFFTQVQALSDSNSLKSASRWSHWLLLLCLWLTLLCSAARPEWLGEPIELPTSGRDLLLAVDISGSMDTRDMIVAGENLDRLTIVKYVVGEFVQRRHQDRLGLILFGTNAYLQAPLTFDRETVNTLLQEAQLGFAGEKTAIGEAIGLGIKRLQDRPESSRVMILLTDGANTAGAVAPLQAAELAKLAGVKIYTIGVGADEITMRSLLNPRGRTFNPSRDLDEDTLMKIAEQTGGRYFRARNPKELIEIYSVLDELEPIEQAAETFRPIRALFYWPLTVALLASILLALKKLSASWWLRASSQQSVVKDSAAEL